jgi:hypothetical protein
MLLCRNVGTARRFFCFAASKLLTIVKQRKEWEPLNLLLRSHHLLFLPRRYAPE